MTIIEGRRTNHRLTFAVLTVAVVGYALLQSLVSPALPTIERALHTSQANVTWVLTAYLLSSAIFTPIMGRLGDMRGKKRFLVVVLIALAVGSVIAALATTLPLMIIGRVIQGVGGGVLPLAFGIIRDEFPEAKVAGAVGLIASLIAVGGGVGIVIAGPIVDLLNYHWLFWIPFIMIGAAGVAAFFFIPESENRKPGRINWFTALLLSIWLVALLGAVTEAPTSGWGSPTVIGLIIGAVIVGVLWVIFERRSSNPLIDMKMMAIRAVWTTNLAALLLGVAMFALFAFLPGFLQIPTVAGYGFGATIALSGVMMLPQAVTMFIVGLFAGRFAQRFGSKNVFVIGSFISLASLLILAFAHDQEWEIYLATAVSGIGFGLAFSSMANIIVAAVPREQTGVASGMNANIRTIGGSVGVAAMASIVTANLLPGGRPVESGYTNGFIMLAGALLLCAIAGLLIPSIKRSRVGDHTEEPTVGLGHAEAAIVAGATVVGDESE